MIELSLSVFLIALLGYLLLTLFPFFLLAKLNLFLSDRININEPIVNLKNLRHDIKGTINTFLVVAVFSILLSVQIELGLSNLGFGEISSLTWFFISTAGIIILHDAYFFVTHLLMHKVPSLYKYHLYHHKSVSPTPFSVFSFHPVEAIIHFIFFNIIALLPVHFGVLILFYAWMLVCNTIGHLNLDFYPEVIFKSKWTKWWNSPTHHYLHHQYFNCNYSIYYNHWDKWFKTNHSENLKVFFQIKNRANLSKQLHATELKSAPPAPWKVPRQDENVMLKLVNRSISQPGHLPAEFQ
ncbi:MAG: hypothetical protein CME65_10775 [Halobacteriovoraceae bacterium]|nr:hypothetical protein [Halobacteriovoraceae bacterium]